MDTQESMRDVVQCLVSLNGKKSIKVFCYVVDKASSSTNIHPEIVKKSYPNMREVYFSKVCSSGGS